jgi:hypothetical protein
MSFVATATAVEAAALEAALAEAAATAAAAAAAETGAGLLAADAAPTIMSTLGSEAGIGALGTGLGGTGIGAGTGALAGTGAGTGGLGMFGVEGAGAGLGAGAGTGVGAGAGSAGAQQAMLDQATQAAMTQGVPQITSGQAAGANVNIPTYANQGPQGPGVQLTQSTGPIEGTAYNPYSISPSSLPSGATTIQSGAKGLGGIGNNAVGTGEGNPSALERGWNSATKFVKDNPMASAMGLSSLSSMMGQNQPNVPQKKKVVGKYSMSPNFQGTFPTANVYQAHYAQGGIAALAGPEGTMYPQSQQMNTQYATPTQMPVSSEMLSGYEVPTDTYSGQQIGMAQGGIAQIKYMADGGDTTPTATPAGPNKSLATIPVNVACTVCDTLISNNNGFTHMAGWAAKRTSALPDLTPFSASAAARGLVICDMLISASDKKIITNNNTTITSNIQRSSVEGAFARITFIASPLEHVENWMAQLNANETLPDVCARELAWLLPHQVCRDHCRAHAVFRAPTVKPFRQFHYLHAVVPALLPLLGKSPRRQAAKEGRQYQTHFCLVPL